MYWNLPDEVKRDFLEDYKHILEKIIQSAERILKDDEVLTKLKKMILDLSTSLS